MPRLSSRLPRPRPPPPLRAGRGMGRERRWEVTDRCSGVAGVPASKAFELIPPLLASTTCNTWGAASWRLAAAGERRRWRRAADQPLVRIAGAQRADAGAPDVAKSGLLLHPGSGCSWLLELFRTWAARAAGAAAARFWCAVRRSGSRAGAAGAAGGASTLELGGRERCSSCRRCWSLWQTAGGDRDRRGAEWEGACERQVSTGRISISRPPASNCGTRMVMAGTE